MACTNDPHSASSQFFINLKDNDFLNHTAPSGQAWGYCVFGKVIDGMDVIDTIAVVDTGNTSGHADVPVFHPDACHSFNAISPLSSHTGKT
jgi:peptidyl-prolyl cis-trans isomerase B (cyclophilin B)